MSSSNLITDETSRSNLAEAISWITRCDDSELRMIQGLLAARLGIPNNNIQSPIQGSKSPITNVTARKNGNPQVPGQLSKWALNPDFQAYRAAMKVAAVQAKYGQRKVRPKHLKGKARKPFSKAIFKWHRARVASRKSGANCHPKTARQVKGQPVSQYDSHPIFQAYRTARKAVKAEIKARGVEFIDLPADVLDPYRDALSAFIKMKVEDRRSKTECQSKTEPPAANKDCSSVKEDSSTEAEGLPTSCTII